MGWCEGRLGVSGEGTAGGIQRESRSLPDLIRAALAVSNTLDECFSAESGAGMNDLAPGAHWAVSGDVFGCRAGREGPLASLG